MINAYLNGNQACNSKNEKNGNQFHFVKVEEKKVSMMMGKGAVGQAAED